MKRPRGEFLVDLAWVVFAGIYCLVASGYPAGGRLVPLAVGMAALVAALVHFSGNFIPFIGRLTHGGTEAGQPSAEIDHSQLIAILWAASLLASIFLIGALAAVFLFFIVYFIVNGRRWVLAIVSAVLMTFVTWGLFGQIMSFPLPQGIIPGLVEHLL